MPKRVQRTSNAGQLALNVPLPEPPPTSPPTYWECRGPHDWRPVLVVCRYGNTAGLKNPPFPHVQTKSNAPRNVQILRPDGHQRIVPVRTLRRKKPE